MKLKSIKAVQLFLLLLLVSCASNPPNQTLNEAENKYKSTQMINGIQNAGAKEMSAAEEALEKAKQLQEDNEDKPLVDHFSTVAIKNTEIAQERYRLKQSEQGIEKANEKRQSLLLQARSNEAAVAKNQLKDAKLEAMKLASQLDELKAEQTERGIILTLENIVFAFDSATLQPGGDQTVARIAKYLNDYPNRSVLIEGFTDSVGNEAYNLKLSSERAESVQRSLIKHGVSSRRLSTTGHGEAYPVASNSTDSGRQENRRVEIVISNQDGKNILSR